MSELVVLCLAAVAPTMVLLRNTRARLFAVVFGAIVVFQSSSGLSPSKLAYLLVLALALVVAAPDYKNSLTTISLAVGAILLGLCAIAVIRGNGAIYVMRDASNYLLLVAAAPLAYHFGRKLPERAIGRFVLAAGLAGAYAFTAEWIANRGLGSLPTPGVPSTVLFALGVCYASARAILSQCSGRWWSLVAALLAAGLVTGTRNMLLLVLCPILIIVFALRTESTASRTSIRRAAVLAIVIIPVVFIFGIVTARGAGIDVNEAFDRVASIAQLDRSEANASLVERQIQQDVAWSAIVESPVAGSGPGTFFRSFMPTSNTYTEAFTMDTSFIIPAKWGLVGATAIAIMLLAWWHLLRPARRFDNVWSLILVGLAPYVVLQSVLSAVVEDRGLPLALVLLGAGTIASRREEQGRPESAGRTPTIRVSRQPYPDPDDWLRGAQDGRVPVAGVGLMSEESRYHGGKHATTR